MDAVAGMGGPAVHTATTATTATTAPTAAIATTEATVTDTRARPGFARTQLVAFPSRVGALPFMAALAGAGGLLAFYLGLITLAQGWGHAVDQLMADRWFVGAIMVGFGTQVGLFTHLRALHAARLRAAAGGTAVSTGTSAAAMLACCAHHLADVFAVLGIAGASTFLTEYKVPLLWLGIGMNAAGAAYLALLIRRARRSGPTCH